VLPVSSILSEKKQNYYPKTVTMAPIAVGKEKESNLARLLGSGMSRSMN
jgi:hypothetical protein